MKTLKLVVLGSVASLAVLSTFPLAAQPLPASVEIHLAAQLKTQPETRGKLIVYPRKVVNFDTKHILQLLGAATSNDFSNARLEYRVPDFKVMNGSNELADVTSFFSNGQPPVDHFGFGFVTTDFQDLTPTSRRHVVDRYLSTWRFDDGAGNSFEVSGLETADLFDRAGTEPGTLQVQEVTVLKAVGTGRVDGELAIFSGSIVVRRKGIWPP